MWNDLTESVDIARVPEKKARRERKNREWISRCPIKNSKLAGTWRGKERRKTIYRPVHNALFHVPPAHPGTPSSLSLSARSVRQLADSSLLSYCISRTPEAACQPALSSRSNEKKKRREGERERGPRRETVIQKKKEIYRTEKEVTKKKKKGEKWTERNCGRKETDVTGIFCESIDQGKRRETTVEMRRYLFSASSPFLSRVSYIRIEKRHRRYVNNNEDRLSYNTYDIYMYIYIVTVRTSMCIPFRGRISSSGQGFNGVWSPGRFLATILQIRLPYFVSRVGCYPR